MDKNCNIATEMDKPCKSKQEMSKYFSQCQEDNFKTFDFIPKEQEKAFSPPRYHIGPKKS